MKKSCTLSFFLSVTALILVSLATPGVLTAQVSGTAFRDYNASGTRTTASPIEPGERGITVTAYKPDGSSVTATTDASGNYSFTAVQIPSGTKVRLEFTGLPTGTFNGAFGAGSATSVQFVTAPATSVNAGVQDPIEFCQTAPDLYTPCYVSGDPLIAGTSGPMPALVKWNYANTGLTPMPSMVSTAAQVGSVWGMAYQRDSRKLFSSTILKRHVGLGSQGLGGIYVTDLNTSTTTPYINLATLGVTLASPAQLTQLAGRGLPSTATSSSSDANALGLVGKVGLGGMDIDPDGGKLWVVNVYEKKLIAVTIGSPAVAGASITAANVAQYVIPNPGCTNGDYRPWAVKYYRGKIYVGVVCDGGTASGVQANLFAYVYEFNPATNTFNPTPVFSTTLNYTKGKVHTGDATLGSKWEPWRDTWVDIHAGSSTGQGVRSARVQPMLSALEFDTDGSLILGLMDRGGHQLGFKQQAVPNNGSYYNGYIGGDILRAQYNVGANTYTLESNGTSGTKVGCGAGTAQGPGNGEFFCADNYPSSGSIIHEETFQGALTIVPGTGELTAMSMDPLAVWSGGPNYMSLNNGANIRRYNIYTTVNGSGTQVGQSQGKANGLGMIAVGCNSAPIEIGNYVWEDLDGDGIQDPSESPLAGITVELLKSNAVISTAVTDASGRYIFSNQTGTSTASNKYGIALLQANMAYQVRIPNVTGGSKQAALGNRSITTATNDPSANGTTRDSDGTLSGSNAVASVTTGVSGSNDHRIDFGFKPACTLSTSGWAVTCDDNGTSNTGADDRFILTLNPTGTVLAATYNVTGSITAGPVNYGSAQQIGGFYNISGGNLTITITDAADANCKLSNVVVVPPSTCSVPPPCLADAPECGSDPGSSTATTEMDILYFINGGTVGGTVIQHSIGAVDVRYNIVSSDGTFSIDGGNQTPNFPNIISPGGIGDGVYALNVANNSGTTSMINQKFSKPISSLLFSIYEMDQTDVVTITGYNKGALVTNPTLTAAGGVPAFTISGNVATGNGTNATAGSINGTLNVSFGAQTLDSVKINFTGGTAVYGIATGDFTFTAFNAPLSTCGTTLSRVDWNAAGVAYTAGSLNQTFTVAGGGETTDFRFTTTGNTSHLSAGSPTEATGVSTGGFFDAGQPSLQILADPAVNSSSTTTSIKLSKARSDVRFSIGDIDAKASNTDQVKVQGFFHGALVKPILRSDNTEGASFYINNMTVSAVPYNSDGSANGTNLATLNVYFPGAVDSIAIMFTEINVAANPAQREMRISDILFCSECGFRAPETALNVTTHGGTTGGGFTTQYALTSPDGTILDIQSSPAFTGTFAPGGYSIYPVNYSGTVTNFTIGQNVNGVLGDCLDASKLSGCNVEVCLPVCDQLVSVTTASACEQATQNAVLNHLASPGQLALYYSTQANLTAAQLYDTPTHAANGIFVVNANITPTGTSTTVPMALPAGNNYTLYAIFASANANYIPPYCLAMVKTAAPFTIFERPVANAGADQSIASGQNAILTATGGGTYLWSTTATTQSISVSPAITTSYTVTVTQNGCTSSDVVQVTVLPPVADAGEDHTICQGETTSLLARGGGAYAWSGGAGNTAAVTVSPVVTTTYTVTVTVGAQTSTDEVIVTVITDLPVPAVTAPQTIPNSATVALTGSGGTYYAWQPNYPDSTATVNVTPPSNATTTYTVTVWKNGCKAVVSTTVTTEPCPASQNICSALGESFTINAEAGLTGYQWFLDGNPIGGATNATYIATQAGTYTWTALENGVCLANGCCPIVLTAYCPCVIPAASFVTVPAGCTNVTPDNDGHIVMTVQTSADKYSVSVGATYTGTGYAAATTITALPFDVQTAIPNTGGTYTIRVYNTSACFRDYTIIVPTRPCPVDPMGYIYCEETGQIIAGGTISVTGPSPVVVTENGSTGQYQFYTDGTAGIYTMTYTPPGGFMLSTTRLPAGTLDPTGQPNPYIIGANSTGGIYLDNSTAAANPFYMVFNLASGDPEIFLNNIALKGCTPTIALRDPCTCHDVEYDATNDPLELLDYIEVTDGPGKTWQVIAESGMEAVSSNVNIPFSIPATLTYDAGTGKYRIQFAHTNGVGYSATLSDGTTTLSISNLCTKATPVYPVFPSSYCSNAAPTALPASQPNFTATYFIGSLTGTQILNFDPALYAGQSSVDVVVRYTPLSSVDCPVTVFIPVPLSTAPALTVQNGIVCGGNAIDLTSLVTGNTPAGTLTFHISQADADAGLNALPNATVSIAATTTYYVRSAVPTGCYATASIQVTAVNSFGLAVVNGSVCPGGGVDLALLVTNSGGGILSFYTSQANALNGVNPLVSSTVSPVSATNYYVRSVASGNAGCATVQEMTVNMAPISCGSATVTGPNQN